LLPRQSGRRAFRSNANHFLPSEQRIEKFFSQSGSPLMVWNVEKKREPRRRVEQKTGGHMHSRHLFLAAASVIAIVPAAASAADARYSVEVPAGPLDMALVQAAQQMNLQLVYTDSAIAQMRAPRISGSYTSREVLNLLLAKTGYSYRFTGPHSVRVLAPAAARTQAVSLMAPQPSPIAEQAQTASSPPPADSAPAAEQPADIVVVGSQIRGSRVTEALPVTVIDAKQVAATGAVSGQELFRSIPQMGSLTFNSQYLANSSNSARGDVGSVNLRELGPGNTLVLLNGRRVVQHPVSQADENLVPVISYNTNAIPVSGIERLEVLRDGAAAIYGTDAVAGVVNTVLRDNTNGVSINTQYGYAEGTNLRESTTNLALGHNFSDGNISLFASYTHRDPLYSADEPYTASNDLRPLFADTRFAGTASLDGRLTTSDYASLSTPAASGTIRRGATSLTTSAGAFHIQPSAQTGCVYSFANGTCLGTGSLATSGANRDARYDTPVADQTTVIPGLDRLNLFLTGHYDVAPGVTIYGEAGYYRAVTRNVVNSTYTLSSQPIVVPASNYWNPFGPVTFANGASNPNRVPGLTNVPATGLPVTIVGYDFSDVGPNVVTDRNYQYRLLAGIRFGLLGFKWDSAALYSQAGVTDISTGVSATLLQQSLALSTPDAYNVFNGGNTSNFSLADTSPSSAVALNAVRISAVRRDTSSLAMVDLKGSNAHLLTLPGGDLGMAIGFEARRETQRDDRDPRVDGTTSFTDAVTGITYPSDLVGTSQTPDTQGSRVVESAYAELAIPVISPEMGVPLMRRVELQVAGRFEHYSDFGSIAKPKVAGAWDIVDGLRIRGSWSKGFKAPNLEQINATLVSRSNTRTDYYRCEAEIAAKTITSIANCTGTNERFGVAELRSGNKNLRPEDSDTWSAGIVLQPHFIPSRFGRFTFTADLWHVRQKGIVGLYGGTNALILDDLLRKQGSSNPNVVRAPTTADDVAAYGNSGFAPAGKVLYITDQYRNFLPQTAQGLDLGFDWQLRNTPIGSFTFDLNAAYLMKFQRDPSPDVLPLIAAQTAGGINAGIVITGGGDLIEQNARPRWRATSTLIWDIGAFELGAFAQYTGKVNDTGLVDSAGVAWVISDQLTGNLYAQWRVPLGKEKGDYRFRVGVRNLTNAPPPLSSSGYNGALYDPYGRYFYVNVGATF
jgi:iron complex outermembrane receptor protein